jgi:hypothetical protein
VPTCLSRRLATSDVATGTHVRSDVLTRLAIALNVSANVLLGLRDMADDAATTPPAIDPDLREHAFRPPTLSPRDRLQQVYGMGKRQDGRGPVGPWGGWPLPPSRPRRTLARRPGIKRPRGGCCRRRSAATGSPRRAPWAAAPPTAPPRIIRQVQDCSPIGAQEQRAVKRGPRPRLGGKACAATQDTRVGTARRPMSKTPQLRGETGDGGRTVAARFDALAASCPRRPGQLPLHDLLRKICATTGTSW